MRRQLKPFVTEYRGGLRRGKDAAIAGEPPAEPSRSRAFEEAHRIFQPDPGEDTYEAALRAADALFARAPRQAPAESMFVTPEPSASSDAMPVRPHGRAALDGAGFTGTLPSPDEPAASQVFNTPSPDTTEAVPPRRILQAIEPPEDDRFAALEAEHAPKRRGRKPGSKNKPKVVIGDDWPAASPTRTAKAHTPASAPNGIGAQHAFKGFAFDSSLDDEILDDETAHDEILDDEVVAVTGSAVPPSDGGETLNAADQADGQPRGRNDKFTRKRAGLRPGERWKRRLPKAAW